MVRVHSGLPFQVSASFSTCDFLPVFAFFQCTNCVFFLVVRARHAEHFLLLAFQAHHDCAEFRYFGHVAAREHDAVPAGPFDTGQV